MQLLHDVHGSGDRFDDVPRVAALHTTYDGVPVAAPYLECETPDLIARQFVSRIRRLAAAAFKRKAFLGSHTRQVGDHHHTGGGQAPHPVVDFVEVNRINPTLAFDLPVDLDVERRANPDRDVARTVVSKGVEADVERCRQIVQSESRITAIGVPRERFSVVS